MSPLSLLLNLLWIVFGGLWMAVGWLIAAAIMAITIIGLPWARAAFNIGLDRLRGLWMAVGWLIAAAIVGDHHHRLPRPTPPTRCCRSAARRSRAATISARRTSAPGRSAFLAI